MTFTEFSEMLVPFGENRTNTTSTDNTNYMTTIDDKVNIVKTTNNTVSVRYVPEPWRDLCVAVTYFLNDDENSLANTTITCDIAENDTLDFVSFRNFTAGLQERVLFSVVLNCHGGAVNLPRYGRAQMLYSLTVVGCLVTGYYAETANYEMDHIPDNLAYYSLINCQVFVTEEGFINYLETTKYSKTFQCGPLNALAITERNISMKYDNFTLTDVHALGNEFHRRQEKVSIKCDYENLLYFENSNKKTLHAQTFINQLQDAVYPNIRVFNFTRCGFKSIPPDFKNWRYSYKNLQRVDFKHNQITEIGLFRNHGDKNDNPNIGVVDLRFNNISTLTMRDIEPLLSYNLLTVDIRNNPFNCACEMKDFIDFMRERFLELPSRYMYFTELKCYTPLILRGKVMVDLTLEEIGCELVKTSILEVPIVVLCSFVVLFTVGVIFGVRYRKEIIILAYTRLNIVLPCQQRDALVQKKYDAFIAYSEADTSWVVHVLTKRLENPDNPQPFRLCLHHRDFMVGGAISDNIIHSVENSRHTVIIVSKHFLKSEWCRMEFRTALHQSLLEKKRHLIIVLLEDIPSSEFEPELKRCMQTLTYVKADDRWFWDKLVYALSDWPKHRRNIRTDTGSTNYTKHNTQNTNK
jgi:hypothetical protein